MAGRTGKQTWYIKQEDGSPLLAAGNVVYAGFAAKSNTTGGVTALDPATGTLLWTLAFGPVSDIGGPMVVEKGVLYVATGDTEKGELWALSAANGGVRRRVAGFPQFGAGTLAVINGVVYAGLDDNKGTVVAVNMASGKTLWQKAVGPATFPPYMATTNGMLFAGTVEGGMAEAQTGKLYALNPKTGDLKWSIPIDGGVNSGPIAASGVVYTAGGNQVSGNGKPVHGILEAWQPSGKKLWSYQSKNFMGNMTVVPGSRVYASGGGYLYSLGA
jgi:outer membrane protein assembly factor BamB